LQLIKCHSGGTQDASLLESWGWEKAVSVSLVLMMRLFAFEEG